MVIYSIQYTIFYGLLYKYYSLILYALLYHSMIFYGLLYYLIVFYELWFIMFNDYQNLRHEYKEII